MKIITDNKWKTPLYGYELTPKERKEFDYLTDEEIAGRAFARYRGWVYDLSDFATIREPLAPHPQRPGWEKWHGYQSDSFFSGVLIRWSDDGEQYQIATYTT